MDVADIEMPRPDQTAWRERGLRGMLESYERRLILSALEIERGNQRRAAQALGILPSTLCEKMKRLGIRSRVSYVHETEHQSADVA